MARRGGGCLTALAVVLSLAVVALGATLLYLAETPDAVEKVLVAREFQEYGWSELAQVAELVAEAATDEEGRAVAESYNVGVGSERAMELDDGTVVRLTVVGIRSDALADGSGVAGLTFMTSPLTLRPMSSSATNAGGWEDSELRSWLAGEGMGLLPDELAASVKTVSKLTNNVGVTSDAGSVTETADGLWLFSAAEVCGQIAWFANEYGEEPNAYTGYVDFAPYDALLSAEGEQYEYFASAGVTGESDPSHVLRLALGTSEVAWWYRSAYPYSYTGEDASFFYQVMASGYPGTTALASDPAGVVAGFCL